MRRMLLCAAIFAVFSITFILTSLDSACAYELFAVGDYGSSYRYDGAEWHGIVDNSFDYLGIWAFSETNIYAIASNSRIYHYDGASWSSIYEVPGGAVLNDIWGASPSEIFVAGESGLVLFCDGEVWTDISIPSGTGINSIWGTSSNDVYAACDVGGFHYTKRLGWQPLSWPAEYDGYQWNAVWCGGEDDVYFVSPDYWGFDTIIIHFNGTDWTSMELPPIAETKELYDMCGVPGDAIYAIGQNGTVLQYEYDPHGGHDPEWVDVSYEELSYHLISVSMNSGGDVFICTLFSVFTYQGSSWIKLMGATGGIRDIFALSGGPLYIAGEGREFGHFDGNEYIQWTPEIIEDLEDVWAAAPDNVYAVGVEGGIYNYDGNSWSEVERLAYRFWGIWGSSENDIYAVGSDVYHYDGVSWELFSDEYVTDVWGTSSTNVYFSGLYGDVFHYDGTELDTIKTPVGGTQERLYGIWAWDESNIYAVGCYIYEDPYWGDIYTDIINHYDGIEWNAYCFYSLPSFNYYNAVWGTSADNIYATGVFYTVKYDGDDWSYLTQEFDGTDIWGSDSDDVYFASYSGVFHYDGVSFDNVLPVDMNLNGIWGVGDDLTPAEAPQPKQVLSQNFPNPFNPNTTISFSLKNRGHASLAVYDVTGRLVRVLLDEMIEAGPHDVTWDGRNRDGSAVASGVYFYRLEAGEFAETRKMVLLR